MNGREASGALLPGVEAPGGLAGQIHAVFYQQPMRVRRHRRRSLRKQRRDAQNVSARGRRDSGRTAMHVNLPVKTLARKTLRTKSSLVLDHAGGDELKQ